jgi:hypothetical protein
MCKAVVAATGDKLIAHDKAAGKIAGVDRGVGAGDVIPPMATPNCPRQDGRIMTALG